MPLTRKEIDSVARAVVAELRAELAAEVTSPLTRFLLSPLGRRIVCYLLDHGPSKGIAIARAVGGSKSLKTVPTKLRLALGDLVARGVLERTGGYNVAWPFRPFAIELCKEMRKSA